MMFRSVMDNLQDVTTSINYVQTKDRPPDPVSGELKQFYALFQ